MFLCSWTVGIHQEPRRLGPEALTWLTRLLEHALPADPTQPQEQEEQEEEETAKKKKKKKKKKKTRKKKGEAKADEAEQPKPEPKAEPKAEPKSSRASGKGPSSFSLAVGAALSEQRGLGATGTVIEDSAGLRALVELGEPPAAPPLSRLRLSLCGRRPTD